MKVNQSWQFVSTIFGSVNVEPDGMTFSGSDRLLTYLNTIKFWDDCSQSSVTVGLDLLESKAVIETLLVSRRSGQGFKAGAKAAKKPNLF
jgi:hypothetical protein